MGTQFKHFVGDRVRYVPHKVKRTADEQQHQHTGSVIYHTTDDFYRVQWDDTKETPNPDPSFFNLETVLKYGRLGQIRKVIQARSEVVIHLMDGEDEDDAIYRFFGENKAIDFFDVVDRWEE